MMRYTLPLAEVVTDFYDELKSRSSGYASFDYEDAGYEESDLVKVYSDINFVLYCSGFWNKLHVKEAYILSGFIICIVDDSVIES